MNAPTTGPYYSHGHGFVCAPDGQHLAQTWNKFEENYPNHEANRRLFATSWELLVALQENVPAYPAVDAICHRGICSQDECRHCQRIKRAHAAIAKATGGVT